MRSLLVGSLLVPFADACFGSNSKCQVRAPGSASEQPAWLEALKKDRVEAQAAIGWKGGVSDQVPWTLTSYIQPQVHPYDRYLWDPVKKEYTVERYLADLKTRYGGIDSVLIWPVYTQIGVDDRNQFDMWRSMPGGLDGVANLTARFHKAGVKMLWPNKPWDTGTHIEPEGLPGSTNTDAKVYAKLLIQTGGDGLNGDTMGFFDEEFYDESAKLGHPISLEPEGGGQDNALNWTTMGWGYWDYPEAPVVDRFKFVTEGKFLTNVCNRWATQKTNDLQSAWFNGDGYESWENVWGIWNGITPYDGEAIRRIGAMLRHFGGEGFLQSPDWEPHTLEVFQEGIYASKFPLAAKSATVWTIVNRKPGKKAVSLVVKEGRNYFDCYHGKRLHAAPAANNLAHVSGPQVTFPIESYGYGCVFETDEDPSDKLQNFLEHMQKITAKPLVSYDYIWKPLPQQMVEIPPTAKATEAPAGTVFVPHAPNFVFVVRGVEIEGDALPKAIDVQYPWEDHPQREHIHHMAVGPFYMDKYPVTNAKFSAYLGATGFQPEDDYNWLKNWNGSATAPAKIADLPVQYISLGEARAYCAWKGARLPHSYEWQYAAQGTDGRMYPWGNDRDQSKFPVEKSGNTFLGSEPVTAHSPDGDSVFGVSDMVGNVWQYTDEFQDNHTRSVIIRGGSNYRPGGSTWYFPQAKALNTHNKYFLFDHRYERAGTLGFRCVVDASSPPSPAPCPSPSGPGMGVIIGAMVGGMAILAAVGAGCYVYKTRPLGAPLHEASMPLTTIM